MTVSIGKESQSLIAKAMATGKYESPEKVLEAALKLLSTYDRKVAEFQTSIQAAIARGGNLTDEEVEASLEAELDVWEREKGIRAAE